MEDLIVDGRIIFKWSFQNKMCWWGFKSCATGWLRNYQRLQQNLSPWMYFIEWRLIYGWMVRKWSRTQHSSVGIEEMEPGVSRRTNNFHYTLTSSLTSTIEALCTWLQHLTTDNSFGMHSPSYDTAIGLFVFLSLVARTLTKVWKILSAMETF